MTPKRVPFRILAAVDGSANAAAAIAALIDGPWPDTARVRVVVGRQTRQAHHRSILLSALDRSADATAERARRSLAQRWPEAESVVVDQVPVKGILGEAGKFHADMIAVGWRGNGNARRLLMGSVARGVVRGAKCAVLVVRRRPSSPIRNILLAFDGSTNASRAAALLARLTPPREGRVTLISVVELMAPTSYGPAVGGIRGSIDRGLKRINKERVDAATRALNRAAQELAHAGWQTRTELKTGEPLRELIDGVSRSQAQLLVLGARGTSGIRQLLLGSVAEGVLNRSAVPVLLAR